MNSLIIYTLVWMVILGGLVYSQSNLAVSSADEQWLVIRTCGVENEETNLFANRIFIIKKSAIQALSHVVGYGDRYTTDKPDCSQILMVGNRSIHVWGTMDRLMDRIAPDNQVDEERWK